MYCLLSSNAQQIQVWPDLLTQLELHFVNIGNKYWL
jgi:hypothetical protein